MQQSAVSFNPAASDAQLLDRWSEASDAEAFAALMRRHAPMVYSIAMRQTGRDAHLADDITQAVFVVLSKRAHRLRRDASLCAWLHQTTRYATLSARRLASRRRHHERGGASTRPESAAALSEIDPRLAVLDEAIGSLPAADRDLIIGRYLQNRALDQLAAECGGSTGATQKRIERAVGRLRAFFQARDLQLTAAAITVTLVVAAQEAATAAPTAFTGPTAASSAANLISKGVFSMMNWTRVKIAAAVAGVLVLAGMAGFEWNRRSLAADPPVAIQPAPSGAAPARTADAGGAAAPAPAPTAQPPAATQPAERRYAAHPTLDVLKVGSFATLNDGIPAGWTETDAFDDGTASISKGDGQTVRLRGSVDARTSIATTLARKPEWKWVTVTARVRTQNIRIDNDGIAAVRFITLDAEGHSLRTIAEIMPQTTGEYRDWLKPSRSVPLEDGEKSIRVEAVIEKATGTFEVDDILIVPTDPDKELDIDRIKTFYAAMDANDLVAIRALVKEDARFLECRSPGGDGMTPLIRTAWSNRPEIAKLLIELGADIKAVDYNWRAPAIGWAGYLGRVDLAQVLIDAGADVNATNGTGTTALGSAEFGLNSRKAGDATDEQRRATIQLLRDHGASTTPKKKAAK